MTLTNEEKTQESDIYRYTKGVHKYTTKKGEIVCKEYVHRVKRKKNEIKERRELCIQKANEIYRKIIDKIKEDITLPFDSNKISNIDEILLEIASLLKVKESILSASSPKT
jgi:hypothetical protein